MEERLLPVGLQSFENIRTEGYVYVDKTDLIQKMIKYYKYVFLSRPRRFGKTLLTNTLKCYFEGKKELFEGLKIAETEKNWVKYPVIKLDMSLYKNKKPEELKKSLSNLMCKYERKFNIETFDDAPGNKLANLIEEIYDKTGVKVVVILDEYDAPLLENIHNMQEIRIILKDFYTPLKACEEYLRFVFITGITKFSHVSIFSTINNLKNISMFDEYSSICGFTEAELYSNFSYDIEQLAIKEKVTVDEIKARLKETYDGYHFSENSEDIYNPFSLLNCFDEKKLLHQWFATATPSALFKILPVKDIKFVEWENIEADATDFDTPFESNKDVIPLLYQSGYLTIKDFNKVRDRFVLGYPNREVKVGLIKQLIPSIMNMERTNTGNVASAMYDALYDDKPEKFIKEFKSFVYQIPYDTFSNKLDAESFEGYYQRVMYIILAMFNYRTKAEQRMLTGRIDLVTTINNITWVIELKMGKNPQEALDQINSEGYYLPFVKPGAEVRKIGISFFYDKEATGVERIQIGSILG